MEHEMKQKLNIRTTLPIMVIMIGILLLIYMIRVEDEPGALPLLLIIVGTIWAVINQRKINKNKKKYNR